MRSATRAEKPAGRLHLTVEFRETVRLIVALALDPGRMGGILLEISWALAHLSPPGPSRVGRIAARAAWWLLGAACGLAVASLLGGGR